MLPEVSRAPADAAVAIDELTVNGAVIEPNGRSGRPAPLPFTSAFDLFVSLPAAFGRWGVFCADDRGASTNLNSGGASHPHAKTPLTQSITSSTVCFMLPVA